MDVWEIRGIRNNNPGNIRENKRIDYDWDGEARLDIDRDFEEFTSPEWGIRAMARILRNYYDKHGLHTIAEIIFRWAPPVDNNDSWSYADHVAELIGWDKNVFIGKSSFEAGLPGIIAAIIKHENGINPYSAELIQKGINLA